MNDVEQRNRPLPRSGREIIFNGTPSTNHNARAAPHQTVTPDSQRRVKQYPGVGWRIPFSHYSLARTLRAGYSNHSE